MGAVSCGAATSTLSWSGRRPRTGVGNSIFLATSYGKRGAVRFTVCANDIKIFISSGNHEKDTDRQRIRYRAGVMDEVEKFVQWWRENPVLCPPAGDPTMRAGGHSGVA